MRKLFFYEIRKNILKLSLLFWLIGLAAVNLYKVRETVRYEGDGGVYLVLLGTESYDEGMKSAFYGEITQEKIDEIIAYSDKMAEMIAKGDFDTQNPSDEFYTGYAYGDNETIKIIKTQVRDAYLYPNAIAEMKERADNAIEFFNEKNEYEVRRYQLIQSLYNGRKINVYGNFEAVELYFSYEFSSFIIMILMIFAFSPIFSNEMLTNTDKIIRSGGRGGSVFWAKHFTMYAFAAVLTVVFSVADLLYFGSFYGLDFFEQPLYTTIDYRFTPYAVSIFGAVALSWLFKILALIFVGEVIMLVSSLTKNLGAAMTLCFAAIGALIFANGYIPEFASPFTLFNAEKMICEFNCVNIFGYPVLSIVPTIIITVLCIVLLHIICYRRTAGKTKGKRRVKSS